MANYVNLTKKTFNPYNPKVLNEGQFSWMTQDTGQQIGSERENTIDVWMYDNQGNSWYEKNYQGYGEFGGMDYYELLARMNGYSEEDLENYKGSFKEMRQLGIDLAFKKLKTKDKGKKVLFPALVADGRYNWKRHDFTREAESDPNQSWYQEPEYDDYYESVAMQLNEWGSSDQNIFNEYIHKYAGKPKQMPSPFDKKLRAAAEDAVDFYWDDWEEYQTDRDGLIDDAVRGYLRRYFKKDFEMMQRMFEPMESVQITEARDWGTYGEFGDKSAVSKVTKTLDKALQKFVLALDKANKEYQAAIQQFTTGAKEEIGNKSGFNDSEGRYAVSGYTENAIQQVFGSTLNYNTDFMYESNEPSWNAVKESLGLLEGRSINKISKDHASTVLAMSTTVKEWKEAEGDRKEELMQKLRELNKQKADLEKELDDAVAGKDRNLQLSLEEAEDLAYLEIEVEKILEQKDEE